MPLYAPDGTLLPDDIQALDQVEASTLTGQAGSDRLTAPDGSPLPEGAKVLATEDTGPGKLESFGRGVLSGATFDFDDNLGLSDPAAKEAARKANPWTNFAGEMVGATLPMVAAGPAGAAIKGTGMAAKVARGALSTLAPAKEIQTLGKATLEGTKLGTVYGGLSGAGHADSPDSASLGENLATRGKGLLGGALVGGLLGAPLGALGHGAASAIGAVANRTMPSLREVLIAANDTELQGVRDFMRQAGLDKVSMDDLRALRQDLTDNPHLYKDQNIVEALEMQRLKLLDPNDPSTITMPPRVTPNLSSWSQDVANTPGEGRTEAVAAFARRKNELANSLSKDIDEVFQPGTPTTLAEGLAAETGAATRLAENERVPMLLDAAFGSGNAATDEAGLAALKASLGKRYDRLRGSKKLVMSEQEVTGILQNHPDAKGALQYAANADMARLAERPGAPLQPSWGTFKIGDGIATFSPENLLDMHHYLANIAKQVPGQPMTAEMMHATQLKNVMSKFVDSKLKGHKALREDYANFKAQTEAVDFGAQLPVLGGERTPAYAFLQKAMEKEQQAIQKLNEAMRAYEKSEAKFVAGTNKREPTGMLKKVENAQAALDGRQQVLHSYRRSFGEGLKKQLENADDAKVGEIVKRWLVPGGQNRIRQIAGEREGAALIKELQVIRARAEGRNLALKGDLDDPALLYLQRLTNDGNIEGAAAFKQGWAQSIKQSLADMTEGKPGRVVDALLTQSGKARIQTVLGEPEATRFIEMLYNKQRQLYSSQRLFGNSDTAYKAARNRSTDALSDAVSGVLHLRPWQVWQATRDLASAAYKQKRADQANKLFAKQGPPEVQKVIDTVLAKNQLANTGKQGRFVTTNGTEVTFNTSLSPLGPFVSTLPGSYDKGRKRQP